MKIAFFYPPSSMPNPIDPALMINSDRGMTGSEGSCWSYAKGLADRGNFVVFFTNTTMPCEVDGLHYIPYSQWFTNYKNQHWDALCSWMTPEALSVADPSQFRIFDQQVSDFLCCELGWESYVDLLMPLSNSHAHYMSSFTGFDKSKWRVAHNGVDTSFFKPLEKISGRIVWASSHDRGLHWLLELWPFIIKSVPHASLHIFYNFNGLNSFSRYENQNPANEVELRFNELGFRSRYTLEAIRRLKDHNVHAFQSVSRKTMAEEMGKASVLAYPLDPVHYTETFGVTVLEACASGTVPVICTADCFGELWAPVSECVPPPYSSHKGEFLDKVINLLGDDKKRNLMSDKCVEYSRLFDWSVLVEQFEQTITSRGASGFPRVKW
jgi:glycosyltransferase involved in cell wall biosynthesis